MADTGLDIESLRPALRSGDPDEYRALVSALTEPLFRYVLPMVGEADAARDVVQQSFVQIFRARRRLRPDSAGSLRSYCFHIATNLARDALRRRARRQRREDEVAAMQSHREQADPALVAQAAEVWRMAVELPEGQREVIALRFAEGFTLAETARVLSIPEGTVSTRQRDGLEALRARLGRDETTRSTMLAGPAGAAALNEALASAAGMAPEALLATPGAHALSVAVPSNLVSVVEATVMASVGAKSIGGLIAAALLLLLLGGGGALAWHWSQSGDGEHSRPALSAAPGDGANAGNPRVVSDDSRDHARESGNGSATGTPPSVPVTGTLPAGTGPATPHGTAPGDSHANAPAPAVEPAAPSHTPPAKTEVFGTVSGKVVDAAGAPVAGVTVKTEYDGDATEAGTPGAGDGRSLTLAMATSAEDGSFIIEIPQGPALANTTSIRLTVQARSTLESGVRYEGERRERTAGPIELARGAKVDGIVLNLGQLSCAVIFRIEGLERMQIHGALERHTRRDSSSRSSVLPPDAEGVYRAYGLTADLTHLKIQAPGIVDRRIPITPVAGQDLDLGTLKLDSAALNGIVVSPAGEPVSGAKISIEMGTPEWRPGQPWSAEPGSVKATTGADGRFTIKGFYTGTFRVTASHEAYARCESEIFAVSGETFVRGAALPELTLHMRNGGEIRGTVTVEGSGPVPHEDGEMPLRPRVGLFPASWFKGDLDHARELVLQRGIENAQTKSETAADGTYALAHIPDGKYVVVAVCGERTVRSPVIEVADGQTLRVNLTIAAGGAVTGRVIGRDGQPLVGAEPHLTDRTGHSTRIGAAVTDSDGRFTMTDVPPGRYVIVLSNEESDLLVSDPAKAARRTVDVRAGETSEINLDLSERTGVSVRGRATVSGKAIFRFMIAVPAGAGDGAMQRAQLAKDGAYDISGLAPGRYYFWFVDDKQIAFARRAVEIVKGQADVALDVDAQSASLRGQIRVPEGTDITKRAQITLTPVMEDHFGPDPLSGMVAVLASAGADGRFEFTTLIAGRYTVRIEIEGLAPRTEIIDISGEATRDFDLGGAAGKLALTISSVEELPTDVISERGSAFARFQLLDAAGNDALVGEDGIFPLAPIENRELPNGLAPGGYTLMLTGVLIEPVSRQIEILAGQTTHVELAIRRAAYALITVENTDLDATQVRAAKVEVYGADGKAVVFDPLMQLLASREGAMSGGKTLRVMPLLAGTYRVVIRADGYAPAEITFTAERGERIERSVTLMR